jgi:hypothetical protein
MPGHVMLVIGHEAGTVFTLHDVASMALRGNDGTLAPLPFNGVVVTPLAPLYTTGGERVLDRITALQSLPPADPPGGRR